MHSLQIGQVLILLTIANGAPVIARKVFGHRWSWPLDAGKIWRDGRPVLGVSKTVRGVTCSVVATMIVATTIGVSWTVGLGAGVAAMAGDLFSSFVKRRLGLPASERATGLDQVPESLLPALVCAYELELAWLDVVIVTGIFFVGEIALSRLLYTLHIRARPH
jgi:CDP-diglyceride synthetase